MMLKFCTAYQGREAGTSNEMHVSQKEGGQCFVKTHWKGLLLC